MTKDVNEMREILVNILSEHLGDLKITSDKFEKFEVTGTIEAMQGKKKVDGFYFATVVPKPKDVRLYFFPTYTHKDKIGVLSEPLQKALKGKSCFHIKSIDDDMRRDLEKIVSKAIALYKEDGLI